MTEADQYKQHAAERALDTVQNGMVLGLGSGSTARYMVLGLGQRLRAGQLHDIVGVPSSDATAALAREVGIPLTGLDDHPQLDLAIDGADEIDPQLNLIKGLGGALLREKIVAASATQFVVIGEASKLVAQLGERVPLPVEVVAFGQALCARRLEELGAEPVLRHTLDGQVFRTDEGHVIYDCTFHSIRDAEALNVAIKAIPGVVDHGLFLGMATRAIVAGSQGVIVMERGN